MLLLDTNIFLEWFIGQEGADECERFWQKNFYRGTFSGGFKVYNSRDEDALNDPVLIPACLRNVESSLGLDMYEMGVKEEIDFYDAV